MNQPTEAPPLDIGNQLLAQRPATQETALVNTPTGQALAYTIRTETTTLTVLLTKDDATSWLEAFKSAVGAMSSAGLIVAGPGLTPMNGGSPMGTGHHDRRAG